MKAIKLTKGYEALVDDQDFVTLSKHKWMANVSKGKVYARRNFWHNGRHCSEQMHRVIMKAPKGTEVDHINGDGLDNRRENLRLCTRHQQVMNRKVNQKNKLGYKGIHVSPYGRYIVQIQIDKKKLYLGVYKELADAIDAYNTAAKKYYGEFAHLNTIGRSQQWA